MKMFTKVILANFFLKINLYYTVHKLGELKKPTFNKDSWVPVKNKIVIRGRKNIYMKIWKYIYENMKIYIWKYVVSLNGHWPQALCTVQNWQWALPTAHLLVGSNLKHFNLCSLTCKHRFYHMAGWVYDTYIPLDNL